MTTDEQAKALETLMHAYDGMTDEQRAAMGNALVRTALAKRATVKTVDLFGNVEDTQLTEIEYNRLAAGLPAEAAEQGHLL